MHRYNAGAMPALPEIRLMLQTLLAERFAVKFHRESRQVDVYALVLTRNDGKLGPGVTPATVDCPNQNSAPCAAQITPNGLHIVGHPMSMLANLLGAAGRFGLGRRVEDRTGLAGRFNMEFQFAPPPAGQPPDPLAVSIFTAVQEQLGVKLESSKGSVESIVVDSAERPTEN